MRRIKFIKDHECDTLKNVEAISVEKYNVNGNAMDRVPPFVSGK